MIFITHFGVFALIIKLRDFFSPLLYMDKVCLKYSGDKVWMCGDTYESLVWNDKTTEKPTKEKMLELYAFVLIDEMRTQRNKLLGESDFRVLIDYEKDKDLWIQYRKKLRDLPATWVDGMDFPSPP